MGNDPVIVVWHIAQTFGHLTGGNSREIRISSENLSYS